MRQRKNRPFSLITVIVGLASCQPTVGVSLNVFVNGLTADVKSIEVDAVLNGVQANEPTRSVTQHLDSFVIAFPGDSIGYLTLRIAGLGLVGSDTCQVATVESRVVITGPGSYDVPVTLVPTKAMCQIVIQTIGDSAGSVILPKDAQCTGDCQVRADTPTHCRGTCKISGHPIATYALRRSDDTIGYFAGWFGDCVRKGDDDASCLAVLGSDVRTVRAYFLKKDYCTADGWCPESDLPPGLGNIKSLWGTSVSDVWAVGDKGTILSSDGTTWTRKPSDFNGTLNSVWSVGPGDAWAVGDGGAIVHWDGIAWSHVDSGTDHNLRAVWGSGPPPVWAVGDGGVILRWDGIRWSVAVSSTTNTLRGIWGPDATDVWAVGDKGTILSLQQDGSWAASPSRASEDLYGVGGTRPSNVWAVGANGATLRWQGQMWTYYPTGISALLSSVWSDPEAGTFAVGESGLLIHLDGISWDPQKQPSMTNMRAVWGAGPSDIWAAGDSGTLIRFRR